ncbi:MAG: hypothetical protein WC867_03850 [Candidatus Pacearchaeota archaeon]|jgi:hypothetical protein
MNNLIILGSGRSGTSLTAGLFNKSGYYFGDNYISSSYSNPKGFYEDSEVNDINEKILFCTKPKKSPFLGEWVNEYDKKGSRWLVRLFPYSKLFSDELIENRIKKIVSNEPFCFKDPRFCYTLPIWRKYLKNTLFICVFREPEITAKSIILECRSSPYLKDVEISYESALDLWNILYKNILMIKSDKQKWLFIHYDQIFTNEGIKKIQKFTGVNIDKNFPDKSLNRTKNKLKAPIEIQDTYHKLCKLADYSIK